MALPNTYTQKPNAFPAFFEAILRAQPPERFSVRFLENLEFKSTNDRLFISVLKDLGFLDSDGAPTERYFQFLDRSRSWKVLAEAIRETYSDLFAVNVEAHKMDADEVYNRLRTLYAGTKKDDVIRKIARTFAALCELADFSPSQPDEQTREPEAKTETKHKHEESLESVIPERKPVSTSIGVKSLQYHINIVLPDSRDPAVHDAIFQSLRHHLQ